MSFACLFFQTLINCGMNANVVQNAASKPIRVVISNFIFNYQFLIVSISFILSIPISIFINSCFTILF